MLRRYWIVLLTLTHFVRFRVYMWDSSSDKGRIEFLLIPFIGLYSLPMEVIVFPDKPSELLLFLSPIDIFTIPIELLDFLVDGPSKVAAILLPLLHTVNSRKISLRILLGIPMILI